MLCKITEMLGCKMEHQGVKWNTWMSNGMLGFKMEHLDVKWKTWIKMECLDVK